MVERCFALLIFGHVLAGYNGHVHNPATAGFTDQRRLLRTMPDTAIMYSQVSRFDIETNFFLIRVVVDEIFLFKEKT